MDNALLLPQKPSLGRIVLYTGPGGGSTEHAAIITKVHSDTCVNLAIFEDPQFSAPVTLRTSVMMATIHADGEQPPAVNCWRWPPRV